MKDEEVWVYDHFIPPKLQSVYPAAVALKTAQVRTDTPSAGNESLAYATTWSHWQCASDCKPLEKHHDDVCVACFIVF